MKKYRYIFYLCIAILVLSGFLFIKENRYIDAVKIIEGLKDKKIVLYCSNFKRIYMNSNTNNQNIKDLELLCLEGVGKLKSNSIDATFLKINEGIEDPYTLSYLELNKYLKKSQKYILIDINRAQTSHGYKYLIDSAYCCPITIYVSKKSSSYENSILFAGRIKAAIDEKYKNIPVYLISTEESDYNQSMAYIGMLVEIGDAANTFSQAEKALHIFCTELIKLYI